ncbi:MAG: ChbG/HpnK family deacetylase [Verrucomicrobiota bacterium]|nr:ChbG/HpnK family deacetylase [Verrucomicrobiota bacterium]
MNADDFGLTSGVTRGIIEAHENGIVTSTSLMVRAAAAEEAAAYARATSTLSVGLHIDLGEWRCSSGEWQLTRRVLCLEDAAAVQQECERQLGLFKSLLGRPPTHLDSHQHVHRSEPARSVLLELAAKLRVPLRHFSSAINYCGSFYGQTDEGAPLPEAISLDALADIIANLSPGWTELSCHPGFSDGLDSVYCSERENELRTLCSDSARDLLTSCKVRLRSFTDHPIVDAPPRGIEDAPRFRG